MTASTSSRARRGLAILGAAAGILFTAPVLVGIAVSLHAAEGRPLLEERPCGGAALRQSPCLRFRTGPGGLGRWLRRSGLDRLPRLFSVLRGDLGLRQAIR